MPARRPRLRIVEGGAFFLAVALAACSGPSGEMRKEINAKIAAGDFAGAQGRIESAKESSYGKKNAVLYYLDLGAVQHDGGKYKESDESLSLAEARMEELYTKSISRETGRFVLNDKTVEYAGDHFERAMVNVYRSLNFILQGDLEGALVEARKLSRLLQEYADTTGPRRAYRDDAFAQFLSSMLYADGGQNDDARISQDAAAAAYAAYAKAYGTPTPKLDASPMNGAGELVFIHGNGVAPRMVSKSFQVAWNECIAAVNATRNDEENAGAARNALRAGFIGNAITVSWPVYVQDPYSIVSSLVKSDALSASTQLVEDVSAIAQKNLSERQAAIRTRSVARAAIKFILAKAIVDGVKKKYGDRSFQAIAAQITANATAAATETADTRSWGSLPAQFRVARLRLPPGEHDVEVEYRNAAGAAVMTRKFHVVTRAGRRTYLQDRTAL